jgi:hypothetical protein
MRIITRYLLQVCTTNPTQSNAIGGLCHILHLSIINIRRALGSGTRWPSEMAHVMTSLHAFMHDWYGIDLIMLDYLMGLAQINNLIILITLWLEINNTGMIIDLTLTQFILLEFIRLY